MKRLLIAMLLLTYVPPVLVADIVVVTDYNKTPKFVLDTATGKVTPVNGVYVEGGETPSVPLPPDKPSDPVPNDQVRKAVKDDAIAIGEADTAKGLSLLYAEVFSKMDKDNLSSDDARQFIDYAFDLVVLNQKGTPAKWTKLKKDLEELTTFMRQKGELTSEADWKNFFKSVSAGLDDVSTGAKLNLNELLDFLLKLFEIFIKLKAGGLF